MKKLVLLFLYIFIMPLLAMRGRFALTDEEIIRLGLVRGYVNQPNAYQGERSSMYFQLKYKTPLTDELILEKNPHWATAGDSLHQNAKNQFLKDAFTRYKTDFLSWRYVHRPQIIWALFLGADPNIEVTKDHKTSLAIVINEMQDFHLAKYLIDKGAILENGDIRINEPRKDGITFLMICARQGYFDLCKALLKMGANVRAMDNYGDTALDIASICERADVVELLEFYGTETLQHRIFRLMFEASEGERQQWRGDDRYEQVQNFFPAILSWKNQKYDGEV